MKKINSPEPSHLMRFVSYIAARLYSPRIFLGTLVVIGFGTSALLLWREQSLREALENTQRELASSTAAFQNRINDIQDKLTSAERDNNYYLDTLAAEQNKNDTLTDKITGIASTVTQLTKLTQTDKELLQKYSRVYFLNENYVPKNLVAIAVEYLNNKNRTTTFQGDAYKYLKDLIEASIADNNPLLVVSAYRSFKEQASLKNAYKTTYGSGSNKFSADQGYSEHQLGTAVDFTTPALGDNFISFGNTDAYNWLLSHAYLYGFILSYPKGNTYYQYEPWHWRFVGVELAYRLHNDGINFYDLDQRTIDTYLTKLFD